ncbi:hypothetical protein RRG08_066563 [Elysia crispata]|uniref:Uncharacterized protein n=1 Tax=Elysia crispata TaxID=231223 RepID=A0AAE1CJY7_9GAST|nr:hypothetical protein RRG08_066563 [Elysia crispata]
MRKRWKRTLHTFQTYEQHQAHNGPSRGFTDEFNGQVYVIAGDLHHFRGHGPAGAWRWMGTAKLPHFT